MIRSTKRILAMLLAFALSLSIIPQNAQAAHSSNWTYLSGYNWIGGSFNAKDEDLVYENNQLYDWYVGIFPSKTPPTTANIVATIADEKGTVIGRCSKTVNGLTRYAENVLCTAQDFPDFSPLLSGTFTLTMQLQSGGKTYATLVQTFSRVYANSIGATIQSPTKPNQVFTFEESLDLVLGLQNLDIATAALQAAVTVTNYKTNELLIAKGLRLPAANIAFKLADLVDLSSITAAGIYQISVTLTDTVGNVQQQTSTTFRVASTPAMEEDVAFETNLSVGYGRVDISPTEPTPLRGYGYSSGRLSRNIKDPLYATCIAVSDDSGQTVLIFTLDIINAFTDVMNAARTQISQVTGIPFDAIMVACTHTHSGPDLDNLNEPSVPRYIESLKGWMTQAAVAALEDRAPALVYTTSTETKNLNFVRRYLLSDGSYAGDNFGSFKNGSIVGHETEADGQMQLVGFRRQEKKDIILANFQTHPHRTGGSTDTNVTADLIAPFREKMESTLDCYFAYFTGASGNINPSSRINEENITGDYIQQGHALADYALDAYYTFKPISASSVKITNTVYKGKVDHTYSAWGAACADMVDYYMKFGDTGIFTNLIKGSGIKNIYQANAVAIRSKMPTYQNITLYAISIGDLAFVTVPFEMFDTNGMQIKEGSPFETTFVLACANNSYSYLPSDLAFQHGGYAVDVTLFVRGTAEQLVTSYLGMLNTLYDDK